MGICTKYLLKKDLIVIVNEDLLNESEKKFKSLSQELIQDMTPKKEEEQEIKEYEISITERRKMEENLGMNEDLFRDFFDNAAIGFHIFGPDRIITGMNKYELNLLGYSLEEIVDKKTWSDLIIPENRHQFEKHWNEILDKKPVKNLEYTLIHKDGHFIDVLLNASPRFDERGNLINTRGSVIDITRRRKMEQALRISEYDLRERVKELNCLFGISQLVEKSEGSFEEIIRGTLELIPSAWQFPEITCARISLHEQEFKTKNFKETSWKQKANIKRRDEIIGTIEVYYLKDKLIFDEGSFLKEKRNLINAFAEILGRYFERKMAEQKSKESEQKFRNFTSQSLMGIGVVQDGLIKYANETLAEIIGYSTKEMMNWSENEFKKLFHPESVEFAMEQAKKKQLGEEDVVRNYQLRIITKTGDVKWIENYSQSTLYEGKFADLVSWIDITDRREAEEKLLESETRYRDAFDRTTFYKDLLTHDMNNILQVIMLTLEISSLDENISKELKESLKSIKNQVLRGSKLVSNVHKLSQLEESQKALQNIDIYNTLEASLNFLKNSFKMKKINLKVDTPRKNYLVKANNILRDIFENILINAVIYNENSTVEILIRFSTEQKEGINYIKVEFMDNGRGIPDAIKKIIFHKGFLEEKQSKGMGIGLTLVKKAIENYNGQIWVEDKIAGDYTEGSNFIIMIPEAV